MKPSESTKPISYLKAHTAEAIGQVAETGTPLIITQNGYAKAIVQDLRSYEETQESLALLKIIAQSRKSTERIKPKSVSQAFKSVRGRATYYAKQLKTDA
jgi:prevent-host-death family protein